MDKFITVRGSWRIKKPPVAGGRKGGKAKNAPPVTKAKPSQGGPLKKEGQQNEWVLTRLRQSK